MANPQVPQGTLIRALTAIQVPQFSQLNVTTGFFANKAARLSWEGDASDYIGNLGGATPSPKLYQIMTCTAYLAKSTFLPALWEAQRQDNVILGDVVVVTDSPTLGPYFMSNAQLQNIPDIELSGENNDFTVIIRGTYAVNNSLF